MPAQPLLARCRFDQLDLTDPFFDSLKEDYQDFYNAALRKRVTRDNLLTQANLDANAYSGFMPLADAQFQAALDLGQVPQGLVVD